MRDKSKFVAFVLSVVPGLAHFYMGLKERGLIFFILLVVGVIGGIGLSILSGGEFFLILTIIGYLVLWLIALIDMFSAWRSIEINQMYNNPEMNGGIPDKKLNRKSTALALSVMPGAGHMYLGYQKKGLIIMGTFLFSIFFMGWLGISMLLFLLPLIWFYSFFDAMYIADGSQDEIKNQDFTLPNIKPEWVGFALIGIGVLVLLERIVMPMIDYKIRNYIQTTIVSLIFISGGIFMLMKNKKNASADAAAEEEEEEGEDTDED
jgi:hypothetical protein